jgi:hypothetical protein
VIPYTKSMARKNGRFTAAQRRLILAVGVADARGHGVPLFGSPRLNRACLRCAEAIRKQHTRRRRGEGED